MKKYIFSVLMAAMAAFTFSSCEDVPAPYTMPEKPADGGSGDAEGTPTGTGTATDPFNCAAAVQYCKSLESGVESTQDVYVKGKVQSIEEQFSANYGNCSVTLVDEDTKVTFKVWRAFYFDNKKWADGGKTINVGDELVFCGKVMNYAGNTPETVQSKAYLYSINGDTGSSTPDTPTTGKGSESDPYTVAEAIETIKAGAPTTEVYLSGIISEVTSYNSTHKSITYYISDDGKSNAMQVYSGKGLNGADFNAKEDLKVGQKVLIKGIIKLYNTTYEVDKTSSIIKIEDGGSTPDTPAASEYEISISNMSSSEAIPENKYGSQSTETESTWFTWKSGNISYAGAKICKASDANGGGIQIQGAASDATKQGFFFNKTAFSNDIKNITIVVRGSNKYDTPTTFSVYEGTAAHPTTNKIEGKYTTAADGNFNVFTMTYDFSAVSSKYFTVWNNAVGALYIDKVIITLK